MVTLQVYAATWNLFKRFLMKILTYLKLIYHIMFFLKKYEHVHAIVEVHNK